MIVCSIKTTSDIKVNILVYINIEDYIALETKREQCEGFWKQVFKEES